jgi:two-component system response regulator FixJ
MMALASGGNVHIVDDDPGVRQTLATMLGGAGFATHEYATASELLAAPDALADGVIVTDVNMPGMSGLELMHQLKDLGINQPVVVISGEADIAMAVEAMKAGAVDFLEKPLHSEPLRNAVRAAMEQRLKPSSPEAERYQKIVLSLTRRQRQVLEGLIEGLPNKLIAHRLDLSIRTVEGYRAAIMERTQAKSLSELVRLAITAGM